MIKKTILLLLITVINLSAFSQKKTTLQGKITDQNKTPLVGVNVYIQDIQKGTTTNSLGDYFINDLETGNVNFDISFTGFESKNLNLTIQEGLNSIDIVLKETVYTLQGVVVTAQKRVQEIVDVPISMSAISNKTIEDLAIQNLDNFADLVPGLNVRIQSNQRPSFIIRGLSSDEVSPNAQPRVSLFFNNSPITRASGGVLELYDMDRIEVLKGPQGTLFGRGAQIGAIHFLTKMPSNKFEGYFSSGLGSYGKREIQTAFNIPIIKNKLNTRIAAVYNVEEGYVNNTFGGKLNGKNTKGVRFSTRFIPSKNTKIDFIFNFQQDRAPGVAFVSGLYPNTNGVNDVFAYEASLDQGKKLGAEKDLFNYILNFRHYFSEKLYLTAITSYQTNKSYERWDGDGSAADALDMTEEIDASQFSQEIRLNYAIGNKIKAFSGMNYLRENVDQSYRFSTNEQHMAYLFLGMPQYMIGTNGLPIAMPALPLDPMLGPLGGMPLPTNREEENVNIAKNIATEFFTDATIELTSKLKLTAGFRIVFDHSVVSNQAKFLSGSPSVLGMLIGSSPNLFFKPSDYQETTSNFSGFTGRLSLTYKLNSNSNMFFTYAKGRRPNVIQYLADGSSEILEDENVHSFDLGFKTMIQNKLLFDATVFYHAYENFQTNAWGVNPADGEFTYIIKDGGQATTYGLETSIQYKVFKQLTLSGNYAYIHARYDKNDKEGADQEYADNQFKLTPDHSFNINLNYQIPISTNVMVFAIPSISYKSHFYFEDANTIGIEQDAYTLANMSAGIRLKNPSLTISLYSQNIFDKKYLVSAGNMGSMFGIPTYIASRPRTFGAKIKWNF